MLKKDYTAKLLNLEDVIITKVENISEEVHVYLELPRTKHRRPACGALTDRAHDYRMQIIRYFKCVSFKPTRLPEVFSIKDSENISKNPGIYSRRGYGSA